MHACWGPLRLSSIKGRPRMGSLTFDLTQVQQWTEAHMPEPKHFKTVSVFASLCNVGLVGTTIYCYYRTAVGGCCAHHAINTSAWSGTRCRLGVRTSTMSRQSATTTSDSSEQCIRASFSVQSLVRALIHSRLDYCNGVLANAPVGLYNKLQSVMRSAARLVLRLPTRASISLAMRIRLHWLPFLSEWLSSCAWWLTNHNF